jgi:hypothetical protein
MTAAPVAIDDRETATAKAEAYGWERKSSNGYSIREEPLGILSPKRIIVIGAGASGICFAKLAKDRLTNVQVQIYDKNPEYGGTWYENRYPGCACDIPSVRTHLGVISNR